jgi:deoxyribonuclease V
VPSVGVTHRPLWAAGPWPELRRASCSRLELEGAVVGAWLCTRDGARPLAIHGGWRTSVVVAVLVVLAATSGGFRTPEPLRLARRLARTARAEAEGRIG